MPEPGRIAAHVAREKNLTVNTATPNLYPQSEAERQRLSRESANYRRHLLSMRQICDLELLLNGGFAPLQSFMTEDEYNSVVADMRLPNGVLFPMPITLDVTEEFATSLELGETIALETAEGVPMALLQVESRWQPNKDTEAREVFGTQSTAHPAVHYLQKQAGSYYLGGTLTGINPPVHHDFTELRHSPAELRQLFAAKGWSKIVAFQTRNPMHRAHVELTRRAAKLAGGGLIINPVVGMTRPGDVDHYSRVRCYRRVLEQMDPAQSDLSLLPLAMRMGGPREAVWHAIIRRNYGFTHFIVGRDHAGPGKDENGKDFYSPYEAQELVESLADEIGIEIVPFQLVLYVPSSDSYHPIEEVAEGVETLQISGTEFRRMLRDGSEVPEWFSYPQVVAELRRTYPPRTAQGFTLFFTGLSGAGKSTVAQCLQARLLEQGGRHITLLDGDMVRRMLSSELGFSQEHRDLNIRRIGYVASKVTASGGIAICAPIAPYAETRRQVREMIEPLGGFLEIYLSTPLNVCEERDRKGLYAKARAGEIKGFTGIDDPYEEPQSPELQFNTANLTPNEVTEQIIARLKKEGYI